MVGKATPSVLSLLPPKLVLLFLTRAFNCNFAVTVLEGSDKGNKCWDTRKIIEEEEVAVFVAEIVEIPREIFGLAVMDDSPILGIFVLGFVHGKRLTRQRADSEKWEIIVENAIVAEVGEIRGCVFCGLLRD